MKPVRFFFVILFSLSLFSASAQEFFDKNIPDTVKSGIYRIKFKREFIQGEFKDYLKDGNWYLLYPSGLIHIFYQYKNGKKDGLYLQINSQGAIILQGHLKNDMLDGEWIKLDGNGRKTLVQNYKKGLLNGERIVYYGGSRTKQELSTYKYGKRDGVTEWFDTKGRRIARYMYKDGIFEGDQIYYYKNGNKKSETYKKALKELKTINGTYADIVHMIAKLQEQYTQNHEKLDKFENTYKTEFYENFKKESNKYKATLTDILDAQAFLLDSVLWKEAKTSKTILAYFNNLPVDVELNTKGYLKYYLNSIDEGKSSQNAKELFELYEYLQEVQKDCILILVESAQDAMEYEKELQQHCKDMKIKAFIDEVTAFKWAMSKPVKIIIIEEYINNTNAKRFLDYYHNAILSKPKIIVIGNSLEISAKKYTISKHLKNASSPKTVAKAAHDSCEEVS